MNSQPSRILPNGTVLPNNYIIDDVLGEGGFGITYSGHSQDNGEKVAIKEYFPSELSYRHTDSDSSHIILPYTGSEIPFRKSYEHFQNEASILKEFQDLQSIVSIKDIIEANGTIYLVMEYIDGITLKQYIKENGVLSFDELFNLITPIIQALIQIHKKGILHRDISPENIMVGTDNRFHLIDFGAASYENSHITKNVTIILKSGYAPPEQYLSDGKQGAWTDIYALAATMYYALTAITPTDSIRRMQTDDLPSLVTLIPIISWQADAIEKGLQLSTALRFRNMESFYQALRIPPMQQNSIYHNYLQHSIEDNKTIIKHTNTTHRLPLHVTKKLFLLLWIIALCILGTIGMVVKRFSDHLTSTTEAAFAKDEDAATFESTTSNSVIDITKPPTTERTTTNTSTGTTRHPDSATSTSATTDTTRSEATSARTTEATTNKPNYNVVPDEEDGYETIEIK